MTWTEAGARRLERSGLAGEPAAQDPAGIAAAMCGAHAQVLSAAELSLMLRTDRGTRTAVRDALWTDHSLVKTYGPRGTVHLLPAADLPMWTGALSAVPAGAGPFAPDVRLTPEQTEQVLAAIEDALADAELTIDELGEAVVAATGPWAGDLVMPAFQGMWPRWRQVMHRAGRRGVLCFGPNRGRKVTYTSPRRARPGFRPADGPTALAALVRRYLYAYGPATSQDFATWVGAPPAWAAGLFATLADDLQQVDFAGSPAWILAGDTAPPAAEPSGVRLLPYFDAYGIACRPRDLLFPGRAAKRALAGRQAGNFPVLLIDGTVAGVWHQRRSGRRIHLTVEPLTPLTARQRRALDTQVLRVGEILEGTAELTMGTVTVGPHA
ncbi:winged helix DNA-binding domain-containing protein [Streptomyces inhibens]|uniref:Winged helix DNA-binding domain-containing protein n=1 Tax=Streptomyces inhibens TaxID=2293571 RepID=A0A371PQP1_STRIH|nr:winged helix DNA-binding domain-containing protein [Streptomyces inhibens]REK84807.1 winged helix DNA-binding domain-containing protein [Streptomyces inhibens]